MSARLSAALGLGMLALALLGGGCGGRGPSLEATAPRADQVELAIAAIERRDYEEARELLRGYLDYDPNGARAAEAHYYLGLAHFRTKEWASAVTEFSLVVNRFSQSLLAPDARYHLALAYWRQSRPAPYDQTYTERSLTEFERFLELYPDHPRTEEIRRLRGEARDRLAKKDYDNGRLYARQSLWTAALFYFREVQRLFPESSWSPWSVLREAEVLIKQGKRDEARARLETLLASGSLPGDLQRDARRRLQEVGGGDGSAARP